MCPNTSVSSVERLLRNAIANNVKEIANTKERFKHNIETEQQNRA